jgi:hypothetical protein
LEENMERISNLGRTGWLVAGILAVIALAPSAAVATAVGVTELAGPGGQRAAVTDAGQLTTTQAAPGSYAVRLSSADAPATHVCEPLPVFSTTKGFIATEVAVDAYDVSAPGDNTAVAIFEGTGCQLRLALEQINPASNGLTVIPVDPGIAIPKGGSMSFEVLDMGALVTVYGYTVPASDVTGYSPTGQTHRALLR